MTIEQKEQELIDEFSDIDRSEERRVGKEFGEGWGPGD